MSPHRPSRIGRAITLPIAVVGLYLLLAGDVSGGELVGAAIVLALAAAYAIALERAGWVSVAVPARGGMALLRGLAGVPAQTVTVAAALLRRPPHEAGDELIRIPFRYGDDAPDEAGRRAAVVLGLSAAPNGFVVDFDEDGALLTHRFVPAPTGGDRDWPR